MTSPSLIVFPAVLFLLAGQVRGAEVPARAIEIGEAQTGDLPEGKEADGIVGDFVLKNAAIEALIGGGLPGRKANMVTNYTAETPGSLYDLCVAGSRNDQLTLFAPGGLEGPLSSVRIGHVCPEEAEVVSERTAGRGKGREERHRYIVRPGWRHVLIVSEYAALTVDEWNRYLPDRPYEDPCLD